MAPEQSRLLRQVTFALLILASMATEIAAVDGRSVLTSLGLATIWIVLTVGLASVLDKCLVTRSNLPDQISPIPPRFVLVILLLLSAAPFLTEPLRRRWLGGGYALELQMVFALRNLGLGLAAFSGWLLCLHLACVVSLFLMLFAISMTNHPAVLTLLGLYTATGSVWLMLAYWNGLERFFIASESTVDMEVQPRNERLPWLAVFVVVAVVGCVLGLIAVGPQRAARVLGEWLPTSGGTGAYDPFARGGVNDGDDEAAGNNPRSTGMVQTDQFLDSPLPTLYDMANDMYGEPFKPREQERAIALVGQTNAKESKKPRADDQRPNREFPTARQGPKQPRDASDRAARALFEVQGRTPLHVRVTAFDAFNGTSWQEAPMNMAICLLEKERDSCWVKVVERQPAAIFAENEGHQFKIASPLGTLLPTPAHVSRFRVGRVDQANFFAWGQDRILRLAQRKTPSGIIVETESRAVDPRLLGQARFVSGYVNERLQYATLPAHLHPEVSVLAHRWADEFPKGWTQISAIVHRLRTEFIHDPSAHTPEDCNDPLAHFLVHARRGPDYQFASACAILLRVLDYPTRLVSGFYVSPDHYDSATRHTPVVKEDLHFWAEVLLPSGDWLVIEPTPGYEVLGPNIAWSERALAGLLAVLLWLWGHIVGVTLFLLSLAAACWKRLELLDTLTTAFVRLFPGQTWRLGVQRVLWLLERRGRWAGCPRPPSLTQSSWLRAVLPAQAENQGNLRQLMNMAQWSSYAPDIAPPWEHSQMRGICRQVLDDWSLRRWRKVAAGNIEDCATNATYLLSPSPPYSGERVGVRGLD